MLASTAVTPPIQIPNFDGGLAIGPNPLLNLLTLPVSGDGLTSLNIPFPPTPSNIGVVLHFQAATVDAASLTGKLSEVGTVQITM